MGTFRMIRNRWNDRREDLRSPVHYIDLYRPRLPYHLIAGIAVVVTVVAEWVIRQL